MGGSRVGSEPVIYQGSGFFPGLVAAGICADAAAVFGTGLRKGRICFSIRPCQSGKKPVGSGYQQQHAGVARRKIDAAFSQAGKAPGNVRLAAYDIERIGEILSEQDTVERIFINFCNPWAPPAPF